jgi:hypothetical protein
LSQSKASLNKSMSELSLAKEGSGAAASSEHLRTVTGVLTSRPTSRDIKIDSFSLGMAGNELIKDCSIELTIGRRYGLIGQNGCGKTNFLQCIANREVRPHVVHSIRIWCIHIAHIWCTHTAHMVLGRLPGVHRTPLSAQVHPAAAACYPAAPCRLYAMG